MQVCQPANRLHAGLLRAGECREESLLREPLLEGGAARLGDMFCPVAAFLLSLLMFPVSLCAQIQLDGTVRSSGLGSPPWGKLVEDLPPLGSWRTTLTDGIGTD